MSKFSKWIRKLKEQIFSSSSHHPSEPHASQDKSSIRVMKDRHPKPSRTLLDSIKSGSLNPQAVSRKTAATVRKPYFLQIGFDFGTAFSKCVIRDVASDRAWVFLPTTVCFPDMPFLIPSKLRFDHRSILPFTCEENHYSADHLSMFKLALHQAISGNINSSLIKEFEDLKSRHKLDANLDVVLETCTTAYLAFAFADIQAHLDQKYKDFGKVAEDSLFVNLAIPTAAADHERISKSFGRALNLGWKLRKSIDRLNGILLKDILQRTIEFRSAGKMDECCYMYPEVSANVQGFVRSRTSSPGIFLFIDTGAGSVDASAFIFSRNDEELVAYLDAGVYPLGSAWIERRAGELLNHTSTEELERLRLLKEGNGHSQELEAARRQIRDELEKKILQLLANIRRNRLHIPDQLLDVSLIFGGGGHTRNPYELSVQNCFHANIFRSPIDPPIIGLPTPRDLQLPKGTDEKWLPRLGVAYGLSFPKYELAPFMLPQDLPDSVKVWSISSYEDNYISNDMC